jgi:hypothetical protein
VQTFLPDPDFARSAAVLDDARLGKQRVETLQVLRALVLDDYGWRHHPAVLMWRGRVPALVAYGLACVDEWVRRGHADSTAAQIAEFAPQVVGRSQAELEAEGLAPSWLHDPALHASHRAALLRKDPAFYGARLAQDVDPQTPYVWPGPDDEAPLGHEPAGRRLWVLRPPAVGVLGRFLSDGVVGLGTASGIASDVTGLTGADLGAVLKQETPGRRPGKALRQLATLLDDVQEGDEVGVPVEGGRALLLGTVRGGYAHAGDGTAPVHRRPVRWDGGRVRRDDVRPRGALQDPRELFAVGVTDRGSA